MTSAAVQDTPLAELASGGWWAGLTSHRWLIGWTGALLFLTGLPYLVAWLLGPSDQVRLGSFWFFRDFSQYLAAMREGASSNSWLIHNHFTAEPHRPVLMYPLYAAIGKLAAMVRPGEAHLSDMLAVYSAVEVASRAALCVSIYQFAALFLADVRARRLAFLLALFSLGLAGWVVPTRLILLGLGLGAWLDNLPDSVNVYLEINTFGIFLSAPHLMLGMALTLFIPRAYLAYVSDRKDRQLRHLGILFASVASLSLIHPFNVPVIISVLAVHAGLHLRGAGGPSGGAGLAAVCVALATAAPMGIYSFLLFQLDPFWSSTYGQQNLMPSPHPLISWVDFGLVMLLAPFGIAALRATARGWRSSDSLLLVWAAAALLWMYAPVPYQRRFGFGLQPALAVLSAAAIIGWQAALADHPVKRRLLNYGVCLLALNTTVLVYVALVLSAATNKPVSVYAWSRAEAQAAEWLSQNSTADDVVLASTESANVLAGLIPGRVVHGHIVATSRQLEKKEIVDRFFSGQAPPDEQEELLHRSRASMVFFGPAERVIGKQRPETLESRQPIYSHEGIEIYRATPRV